MSLLKQKTVKILSAQCKPWGYFSWLHCSVHLTQDVCSPKEDNGTHQPEAGSPAWSHGTQTCLLSLGAEPHCIRLSKRTASEWMNAYSFASAISLTQPSFIETLSFSGKPLYLLLGLYFCFLIDKQIEESLWMFHAGLSISLCIAAILFHSQIQKSSKIHDGKSLSGPVHWVLHSCRLSGPRCGWQWHWVRALWQCLLHECEQ